LGAGFLVRPTPRSPASGGHPDSTARDVQRVLSGDMRGVLPATGRDAEWLGAGVLGDGGSERRETRGRPTSRLAAYIREHANDGTALAEHVLAVLRGVETIVLPDGSELKIPASSRLRLEAATWLADRGWGRPAPMVEEKEPEKTDHKHDISKLTSPELLELRRLVLKVFGEELPPEDLPDPPLEVQ
jgi:hypothetical protein